MNAGTEILIILLLLMANGLFAMAELAIVSARKTRLRQLADAGDARAAKALALAEEPTRFLATVQFGITLIGVMAGAFGGATLSRELAAGIAMFPPLAPYAPALGIAVVVAGITFASLVLGELVPKRIALAAPEAVATRVAGPLDRLARIASPLVGLLTEATTMVLRVFGFRDAGSPSVSEEEVRSLVEQGVEAGVFANAEPAMVGRVLALDRTPVKDIMTPRAQLVFLDRNAPHEAFWHKIVVASHSAFPVFEGNRDNITGVVTIKSIYANLAAGIEVRLADLAEPPVIVSAVQPVSGLLETFKRSGRHAALVADEYGGIVGMVTLVDVLEEIVGEMPAQGDRSRPRMRRREDGSFLADGFLDIGAVAAELGGIRVREENDGEFETLAGFISCRLGHLPEEGEHFSWEGWKFEVVDMDRHRIDKVLVSPLAPTD